MTTDRPSTPNQHEYANQLLIDRMVPDSAREAIEPLIGDLTRTMQELANAINYLQVWPPKRGAARQARRPAPEGITPGMYRHDGTIYRVVQGRANLYTKRLVIRDHGSASFEFDRDGIYALTPADRLDADAAAGLGLTVGVCIVCSAALTDPKSVARGIGPVCAKRV